MDSTHDCKSYQEVDMKKQSLFVTHKSTEKRLFMIIDVVDYSVEGIGRSSIKKITNCIRVVASCSLTVPS